MRWSPAVAVLVLYPCFADAQQCSSGLQVQPGPPPSLPGRAAFQGYDGGGNTHLFLFNFTTHRQQEFPLDRIGIIDPLNPNFSPDGLWIVFTGTYASTGIKSVFILRLETGVVTDLTPADVFGQPNEDPKFSANQQHVILKHEYNIVEYTIDLSNPERPSLSLYKIFTTNGVNGGPSEASDPSLSPHEDYVLFARGSGTGERVSIMATDTLAETQFSSGDLYAYYGTVRDYWVNLYTGFSKKTCNNDQIFMQSPGRVGQSAIHLSLNDPDADNSDPATVDEERIIFSNDSCRSNHIYRAYLGALHSSAVWDLYRIGLGSGADTVGGVLGLDYTPTP